MFKKIAAICLLSSSLLYSHKDTSTNQRETTLSNQLDRFKELQKIIGALSAAYQLQSQNSISSNSLPPQLQAPNNLCPAEKEIQNLLYTLPKDLHKTAQYLYQHNQGFLIERINACYHAKHPQALINAAEKNSKEIEDLENTLKLIRAHKI